LFPVRRLSPEEVAELLNLGGRVDFYRIRPPLEPPPRAGQEADAPEPPDSKPAPKSLDDDDFVEFAESPPVI
jgi:hypothetical protein